MGQSQTSACKDFIPDTIDTIQFQIKKHSKIFSDLNDLTYENFKESIDELNELSRKCIDKDGNQLVFAINKGSDQFHFLWKATIKIACVSINPESRAISNIKMINLKQFLHIFNTMVTNLEAIEAIEERQRSASSSPANFYPSSILNQLNNDPKFTFNESDDDYLDECIICLERKPDVILSCLHSFCAPCIEQWNEGKKNCPICDDKLQSTKDSWVQLEIPDADEINEEIVNQLQKITTDGK
ncbi:RING finger protein 141-like [Chironomus tepperi]|uniref:RING finger protein 141-like n=1 Tax=Chironomus tepperi TaxID=113505 RepID=UPI00391FA45D